MQQAASRSGRAPAAIGNGRGWEVNEALRERGLGAGRAGRGERADERRRVPDRRRLEERRCGPAVGIAAPPLPRAGPLWCGGSCPGAPPPFGPPGREAAARPGAAGWALGASPVALNPAGGGGGRVSGRAPLVRGRRGHGPGGGGCWRGRVRAGLSLEVSPWSVSGSRAGCGCAEKSFRRQPMP